MMPPYRKRATRRQRPGLELTPGVRMLLTIGAEFGLRLERGLRTGHIDDDERRELWEEHGPVILAEWIEAKPGSRPWGWWQYDAPERRRCVGGVHPFDDPSRNEYIRQWATEHPEAAAAGHKLCFGVPACGIPGFGDEDLEYETEAAFLDRLGLWIGDERERWARMPVDADGDSE